MLRKKRKRQRDLSSEITNGELRIREGDVCPFRVEKLGGGGEGCFPGGGQARETRRTHQEGPAPSGLVSLLQRSRIGSTHHVDETHCRERACMMMEARLSAYLQWADQIPQRAGGMVPVCLRRPETRESGWCSQSKSGQLQAQEEQSCSLSLKTGGSRCLGSEVQRTVPSHLRSPLVLLRASNHPAGRLTYPHLGQPSSLLHLEFRGESHPETPSRTQLD